MLVHHEPRLSVIGSSPTTHEPCHCTRIASMAIALGVTVGTRLGISSHLLAEPMVAGWLGIPVG